MQKAEPQHANAQNQPAAKKSEITTVEPNQTKDITQRKAMIASSPQTAWVGNMAAMMNAAPVTNSNPARAARLRMMETAANGKQPPLQRMVGMIHNSPRQQASQNFSDNINNNPMMVEQRVGDEEPLQRKSASASPSQLKQQIVAKPNNTGLPDNLKSGIENLSGMSMDNVKVHYNSAQPAQLNALAYAQGTDIHVAPGQEKHLPHEAWHVVQQAQGRVRSTMQMRGGVPVNDDAGLEREADLMGGKALVPTTQLAGSESVHFSARQTRYLPDRGVHVVQQEQVRAISNLQPSSGHSAHIVQMLPLTEPPPEDRGLESLRTYFATYLIPELRQAEDDDKVPVSQYAPWWKHDVLVSATRLQQYLAKPDDSQADEEADRLAEMLFNPAPVLELIPGVLNNPTEEEHGELSVRTWTEEEFRLLTGKKEALLSGDVSKREGALKEIRGKDKKYHVGQGAILRKFIMEERKAIMGLVSAAIGSDAIFSLERGGSMISDLIVRLGSVIQKVEFNSIKEPKVMMPNPNRVEGAAEFVEDKKTQRINFLNKIREFVKQRASKGNEVVISIAETAVGGSSVNELLDDVHQLDKEFQSNRYNVKFRILVARETIKNVNYEGEGRLKLRDPAKKQPGEAVPWERNKTTKGIKGIAYPEKLESSSSGKGVQPQVELPLSRVEMYVSQLRYLIGEDVDYQLSYENPHHPVIVFDEGGKTLRGVSIEPSEDNDSAREIIIDLIAGAYDSVLNQVFGEDK